MSSYDDQEFSCVSSLDQTLDFFSAVANLDFGPASLAYDELTKSEISRSSSLKEFRFLDSQAPRQAYTTCIPQSESVDQFCCSSGELSGVPPIGAERSNCLKVTPIGTERGNCLKVAAVAKEMRCERWFQLPCIEKWLIKNTYFLPLKFAVPVLVLVMSMLIMKTYSKT